MDWVGRVMKKGSSMGVPVRLLSVVGVAAVWVGVAAGQTSVPAAEPAVAAERARVAPQVAAHDWKPGDAIDDADDLLVALETADADITTFTAGLRYTRMFALAGDEQIRDGTLYFETLDRGGPGVPASRRFAVRFKSLQVGSRVETEPKEYIFDGEWLVEKLEKSKDFIKRQVVPPGERFDPLRIGEGPFPVPLGQRRDEVLERYEARLAPVEEGLDAESLVKFVSGGGAGGGGGGGGGKKDEGTWQLVLTPRVKPQNADEQTLIRVWYRKGDLLPRLAVTENVAGDVSIVQMLNPEKNPKQLPHRVFDTAVPARGWNVRIEPYRVAGQAEAPAAEAGTGPE